MKWLKSKPTYKGIGKQQIEIWCDLCRKRVSVNAWAYEPIKLSWLEWFFTHRSVYKMGPLTVLIHGCAQCSGQVKHISWQANPADPNAIIADPRCPIDDGGGG